MSGYHLSFVLPKSSPISAISILTSVEVDPLGVTRIYTAPAFSVRERITTHAGKMSPPVLDLGDRDVQQYKDGQLKWIIENGIRFSGMPGWKGVLEDDEMWSIVRFIRHLPEKGSQGIPAVFKESEEEHQEMMQSPEQHRGAEHEHPHE